jgi:hypothetical protein
MHGLSIFEVSLKVGIECVPTARVRIKTLVHLDHFKNPAAREHGEHYPVPITIDLL